MLKEACCSRHRVIMVSVGKYLFEYTEYRTNGSSEYILFLELLELKITPNY